MRSTIRQIGATPRPGRLGLQFATVIRTAILITSALIGLSACGRDDAAPRVDPDERAQRLARDMQAQARACEPAPEQRDRAACERACALGHSNSCAQLGALSLAAGDRDGALSHFGNACRGGSGVGCEGAAELSGNASLYRQARGFHRVHCEQGYARSCAALAELFRSERGGAPSPGAADYYQRRACALDWPGACAPPSTP